jgi:hypothetical protein
MRRTLAIALLALALPGAACPKAAEMEPPPRRSSDQPPPRDGNVAIQEELDAARRERTAEAYDRFIARHPDHALAAVARREKALLSAQGRR